MFKSIEEYVNEGINGREYVYEANVCVECTLVTLEILFIVIPTWRCVVLWSSSVAWNECDVNDVLWKCFYCSSNYKSNVMKLLYFRFGPRLLFLWWCEYAKDTFILFTRGNVLYCSLTAWLMWDFERYLITVMYLMIEDFGYWIEYEDVKSIDYCYWLILHYLKTAILKSLLHYCGFVI